MIILRNRKTFIVPPSVFKELSAIIGPDMEPIAISQVTKKLQAYDWLEDVPADIVHPANALFWKGDLIVEDNR